MLHLHQLRLQQQQYQQHEQQQQLVVCLQMIPASIQLPSISSALAGGAAQRGFAADSSSHKRGISSLCQQLQEQLNQAAAQLGGTGDNGDAAAAAGTHKHTAQDTPNAGSNAASSSSSSDVYGRHYVDPDADLGFGGGPDGTSATGPDAKLLTVCIRKSTTVGQLQQLVNQHGSSMDYIHLAAAVNMLGSWQREGNISSSRHQKQVQRLVADIDQLLVPSVLDQCGCFALAQLVWGLGLLGHTGSGLFAACLNRFLLRLDGRNAINVSSVLYGVAKSGWQLKPQQLQQLLAAAVGLQLDLDSQAAANIMWAVATMWPYLMKQLSLQQQQQVLQQLQPLVLFLAKEVASAKPQAVTNSLWACAQLNLHPVELFAALDSQQQWDRLLPTMKGQELSNTALACAVLDHRDEQLLARLLQRALHQQSSSSSSSMRLSAQGVCNLCWSVAVLDLQQLAGSIVELVHQANRQQQRAELEPEDARQLQQVQQWLLDKQLVGGRGLAGALTEQQLQQCSTAFSKNLNTSAAEPPSETQRQVFAALLQLTAAGVLSWQHSPQQEQLAVPDGACLIDIAGMTADGMRLAIEVDRPYHFLWPDRRLDGSTQHRNRVLAARGYAVVSVPYYMWNNLKISREKQQCLLQLIKEALKNWKQHHLQGTPAAGTLTAAHRSTAHVAKAKHRQQPPRRSTAGS